ncbi:DUF4328 domain-containing protein [Streptomyces huasconensis]|uniref:DUF4328 domain-containing protein n=1 Tax=Streptomyces huasconensis TaxID=1854574 RepID=A0ABV3LNC6_9ACTN
MLCKACQFNTATTSQGYCGVCVQAAAAAPPPGPAMVDGRAAWLRSPVGLGRATAVLLGLVIATDVYSLWTGTVMQDVLGKLVGGAYGADIEREADHADTLYANTGIAQTVALLATCVVFLVWFHRVRVNAEVFEPHIHRKKRGWTVWGWFVPVVNLWFPRRIAVDIWDASGTRSATPDGMPPLDPAAERGPHRLVNVWWALWVANLFAGRWATQSYMKAEEADEIKAAVANMMFTDALDIAAAVLAIVFVLRLTRMQDTKARMGPAPAPQSAAFPAAP